MTTQSTMPHRLGSLGADLIDPLKTEKACDLQRKFEPIFRTAMAEVLPCEAEPLVERLCALWPELWEASGGAELVALPHSVDRSKRLYALAEDIVRAVRLSLRETLSPQLLSLLVLILSGSIARERIADPQGLMSARIVSARMQQIAWLDEQETEVFERRK